MTVLGNFLLYHKFFGKGSFVEFPVKIKEMSNSDADVTAKIERHLTSPRVLIDRLKVAVKTPTSEGYAIPAVIVEIHGSSGYVYIENLGDNSSQFTGKNLPAAISSVLTGELRGFAIVHQSMTQDET